MVNGITSAFAASSRQSPRLERGFSVPGSLPEEHQQLSLLFMTPSERYTDSSCLGLRSPCSWGRLPASLRKVTRKRYRKPRKSPPVKADETRDGGIGGFAARLQPAEATPRHRDAAWGTDPSQAPNVRPTVSLHRGDRPRPLPTRG